MSERSGDPAGGECFGSRCPWPGSEVKSGTARPGNSYSNDILGNRTGITPTPSGSVTGNYTWDCLNRLLTTTQPVVSTGGLTGASTASMSYEYRADGMRVEKILHSGMFTSSIPGGPPGGEIDDQYTRYRYDIQMPFETYVVKADGSTVLTDMGLGARGPEYVSLTQTPSGGSSGTTTLFPIYDAHGNEIATLSRSGSSYSLSNQRSYGAWGEVRQGLSTGGPRGRHVANLGHVQDDETGLVYMRDRYYETSSGRFLTQDTAMKGWNWFTYCHSDPVNFLDFSGKDDKSDAMNLDLYGFASFLAGIILAASSKTPGSLLIAIGLCLLGCALMSASLMIAPPGLGNVLLGGSGLSGSATWVIQALGPMFVSSIKGECTQLAMAKFEGEGGIAVAACAVYALLLLAYIAMC